MITLAGWTGAVFAVSYIATLTLSRAVGGRSIGLGPLGELRIVPARIWLSRHRTSPLTTVWTVWLLSAMCLTVVAAALPDIRALGGLLLGGSLAHAVETTRYGNVSDYICLRFWPAFDVADVALAVGAAGIILELCRAR